MALTIASWIRYLGGDKENGELIEYEDPMSDVLKPFAWKAINDENVEKFMYEAFGKQLGKEKAFHELVNKHLQRLNRGGVM